MLLSYDTGLHIIKKGKEIIKANPGCFDVSKYRIFRMPFYFFENSLLFFLLGQEEILGYQFFTKTK